MKRRYEIYRGSKLLGYVGFDDQAPCEPFEPAEAFAETETLFNREYEASARAGEVNEDKEPDRFDKLMSEAEEIMDEIVAPGIRFKALEDTLCSFDCTQLSIFDGRVCWR